MLLFFTRKEGLAISRPDERSGFRRKCASEGEEVPPIGHRLRIHLDFRIEKKILCYGVIISTNDAVVSLQGFLIGFINELFSLARPSIGPMGSFEGQSTMRR